ncbi:MAG: hypothetical protein ACYC6J_02040 [Coriobacteriia bacterium]
MLEFARIAVGDGAPLGCISCEQPSVASYPPASELGRAIAEAVSGFSRIPGPNVCLTGPEPFEHPELPALVAACVQAGAQRVALETDGAALCVPANASGILSAGVRHLHVRLLAAEEALGDRLGGRQGRTRDASAGVTAFLSAAAAADLTVAVTAVVPVCRHNLASLPDTVSRCAELKMHAIRLLQGAELPSSAPAVLAAACDTGMVNGVWVEADTSLPLPVAHRVHVVEGHCD